MNDSSSAAGSSSEKSTQAYVIKGAVKDGRTRDGYLAVESGSGRKVVIRKLAEPGRISDEQLSFIRRRYRMIRNINHPGIVPLVNLVEMQKGIFLVEEFTGGMTLREMIQGYRRKGDVLTASAFLVIGNQLVRSVLAAHKQQVVHGRLSPMKVLIDEHRDIRITDFMFAPPKESEIRQLGKYAAPELLRERPTFSRYSDTYAVAVILHELLVVRSRKIPGKYILPRWFRKYRTFFTSALQSNPEKRETGLTEILDGLQKIEAERLRKQDVDDFGKTLKQLFEEKASR